MLKFLRKNTKAIVWAVVISFVAWGGYAVSVQFGESNRSPGRIFGKEVSFRDYVLASRAVQIFVRPPEGAEPPDAQMLEAETWQFLVLSHEAKKKKIQVTDQEVRNAIGEILGEKRGVLLTSEQYLRWVRSNFREEPREFENQLREHLRIRKLLAEIKKGLGEDPEEALKKWLTELFTQAKIQVYQTQRG